MLAKKRKLANLKDKIIQMSFDSLTNIDLVLIVGMIFFVSGFLLLIYNLRSIIRAKSSKNWEKANGLVLDSKLVDFSMTGDSSHSYKPKVEYGYMINEKEFRSKRIYFGSNIMSSFKKGKSIRIVNKYPKGTKITVYYNPLNEKLSVLETGIKSELVFGIVFGFLFLGLGYLFLTETDLIRQIMNK